MRDYELALVFAPSLEQETKEKVLAKIKKMLEDAGGSLQKQEEWGKRELAYPIKKQSEGVFFLWNIALPPQSVNDFERRVKLEEAILRFLLVRNEGEHPVSDVKSDVKEVKAKKGKGVKKVK